MAEGIFALLGVLVGGLIAAGTTYWMDRKREDRKVQAAARQAFIDLYAIAFSLNTAPAIAGDLDPLQEIKNRLEHYLHTSRRLRFICGSGTTWWSGEWLNSSGLSFRTRRIGRVPS